MAAWEYLTLCVTGDGGRSSHVADVRIAGGARLTEQEALDELGRAGWELAGVAPTQDGSRQLYFKRVRAAASAEARSAAAAADALSLATAPRLVGAGVGVLDRDWPGGEPDPSRYLG